MKNKTALLFIIVFLAWNSTGLGQQDMPLCNVSEHAFQSGEKLTYALYYNWNFVWIPAGELEFFIEESEDKYNIKVIGKTLESYNWFYRVNDQYHCVMDKNSFQPEYYLRDIEEGNYKIWNEIIYNYEKDSVYSRVKLNDQPVENYDFPMESCVLDLLSLCYKLRNMEIDSLKKTEEVDIDLIFDEKIFNIPIRYIGEKRAKKIRGLGRINLHKISPDLIAGHVFEEGQQMMIWVSQDGNKIPVLIESPIKVGSIKAVLKAYENLKYPLELVTEE